jgi:adenylate cyclase
LLSDTPFAAPFLQIMPLRIGILAYIGHDKRPERENFMERRLAAILAADVAGYTRLMGRDEAGTLARLTALRKETLEPLIAEHRGRVVKLMGDGFLVEFASLVDAVGCAIAWQARVTDREKGEDDNALRFRIGINIGDVLIDDQDIYGDGVNIASRLEGLADPGGICISGDAFRQVRGRVEAEFDDMGERELKNVAEPVRVYRIGPGSEKAAKISSPRRDFAEPDKPSIAVLPFNNMSGDPEQEYFSDGISEDIITDLSKVSGLFVIARNSSFVYKNKSVNISDVCRELGVKYALEGSIRRAGNRIRITAQLIEGAKGGHMWAERYDRDMTDIFEVQDDVTQKIVTALKVKLTETEKSRITESGTRNIDAHDAFLRGRDALFGPGRDSEAFDRSLAHFKHAADLDPDFGAAYAGIAMSLLLGFQNDWSANREKALVDAGGFVKKAIELGDDDAFCHYVASIHGMWTRDYETWAREAERAHALNPNFALAVAARAIVHIYTGEPEKAIPYLERAIRLDPAFQHQQIHFLGVAHLVAGDYEGAAQLFRDRILLKPNTDLSRAFLASALGHLGRKEEAKEVWDELMKINPRYSYEQHIGRLPFKDPADAKRITDGLTKAGLVA